MRREYFDFHFIMAVRPRGNRIENYSVSVPINDTMYDDFLSYVDVEPFDHGKYPDERQRLYQGESSDEVKFTSKYIEISSDRGLVLVYYSSFEGKSVKKDDFNIYEDFIRINCTSNNTLEFTMLCAGEWKTEDDIHGNVTVYDYEAVVKNDLETKHFNIYPYEKHHYAGMITDEFLENRLWINLYTGSNSVEVRSGVLRIEFVDG